MKQLKVRFAREDEKPKVEARLKANPLNEFDPRIMQAPTLQVACAYSESDEYFLPMQRVLMLESLGRDTPPDALRDLTKAAELIASSHGIRELYFLDGAGGIGELAKNHGFTELPYKVYRMNL